MPQRVPGGEDIFGDALVGLPWQTPRRFLRIMTNPRLPGTIYSARGSPHHRTWLEQPNLRMLAPGEQHWAFFRHGP